MFLIIGYASRNAGDSVGVNCIMGTKCLALVSNSCDLVAAGIPVFGATNSMVT